MESVIYEWLYEAGTDSFRAVLPLLKTREQARQEAEESEEEDTESRTTSETGSEE
jgi:hypothetical protein